MRATILIALALILFFCDYRFHCFAGLRSRLAFITLPIQYVINWPLELTRTISDNFISKRAVLTENARFRNELQLSNAKQQRLDFLEYENYELRTLLKISRHINYILNW